MVEGQDYQIDPDALIGMLETIVALQEFATEVQANAEHMDSNGVHMAVKDAIAVLLQRYPSLVSAEKRLSGHSARIGNDKEMGHG